MPRSGRRATRRKSGGGRKRRSRSQTRSQTRAQTRARSRSLSKSTSRHNRHKEKRGWVGSKWFKLKRNVGQNKVDYLLGTLLALGASYATYRYMNADQLQKAINLRQGQGDPDLAGVDTAKVSGIHLGTSQRTVPQNDADRKASMENLHQKAVTTNAAAVAAKAEAETRKNELKTTGAVATPKERERLRLATEQLQAAQEQVAEDDPAKAKKAQERVDAAAKEVDALEQKIADRPREESEQLVQEAQHEASDKKHEATATQIGADVMETDVLATTAAEASQLTLETTATVTQMAKDKALETGVSAEDSAAAARSDPNVVAAVDADDKAHATTVLHTQDHFQHVGRQQHHVGQMTQEGHLRTEDVELRNKLDTLQHSLAQAEMDMVALRTYGNEMDRARDKFKAQIPRFKQMYDNSRLPGYVHMYGPDSFASCGWRLGCYGPYNFEQMVRKPDNRDQFADAVAKFIPTNRTLPVPFFPWKVRGFFTKNNYDNRVTFQSLHRNLVHRISDFKGKIQELEKKLG
jgi:chemotaxis protein histidine kinase CheA